ncbi:hypothetical protein DKX38_002540 [Salix brachista]|uniref:Divalent cation tolerance protein CutA n=1 Tax=Salix brachista TaxID=2182728 RepID=A0A5N5NNY2_9ROSI|nr:hypothetical protein DKX38_002540 [Salix brachista]
MNSARVVICHKHRSFSSLPWISPLHFLTPKLDPPPKTLLEPRRKPKFISHETAINLIKHERDPQHALEIFNMVVEQKGFNHNHATYSTIIDKLARAKKFQAVDALLRQMMYETCKFHESLFLNLMKYFAKSSLYERVVEMFNKIQPIVREKPSLKAISTCLNLLVESKQVDLLRGFLLDLKKGYMLKPNTCIFNILINPNIFNYSALMSGFCKEGRLEEAMDAFKEMKSFGLKQDTVGYTTLINYFCRFGRIDEAMVLLEEMKETKCKADVVTVNVLLRGFCGEGRTEEALGMLNRLSSEGIYLNKASYRIVLNSLCQKGELDKALELLGLTLSRGFLPHHATSNELLVGLCKAGKADDAVVALYGLAEMGFKPEPDSWALLVEFVCRERKLLLGFELLDELTANECENSVSLSTPILSSTTIRRRLPLVGAFCMLSLGLYNTCPTTISSSLKMGNALSLSFIPLFRTKSCSSRAAATQASNIRMEGSSDTVPSIVVYVTVPNREAGKKLAHSIVKEKLAACVNIVRLGMQHCNRLSYELISPPLRPAQYPTTHVLSPGAFLLLRLYLLNALAIHLSIESVYQWQGEIQSDAEELLIIKTRQSLLEALTEHVKANHEYEVPEVISLPITGGSIPYLKWLKDSTRD